MPLKSRKKTVIEVEYGDLERFVKETYKQKEYSFVAAQECGNDSSHSFSIEKELLDEYDQKKLDAFTKTGKYGFINHTVLQDLVNRDLIEPGNYVIRVSW